MEIEKLPLEGALLIKPKIFYDERGYFFESFQRERYRQAGIEVDFVQDNESFSKKHVLRGLHFQKEPYAQAKLVRVVQGRILDVIVDLRRNSPTFGKHLMVELSAENNFQLYVPIGFAHGFLAMEEINRVHYKCSAYYYPNAERTILWHDPDLAIPWPVNEPIVSKKDQQGYYFKDGFTDFF